MLLAVRLSSYRCTWEVGKLGEHLGSWESTREAEAYASLVLSQLPACIHNSIDAR